MQSPPSNRPRLSRSRRVWIGAAVSLVLLVLFFYRVDFGEIGRALAGANYVYVLPAVAVLVALMALKAVRWQYLLKHMKPVRLGRVFSAEVIGHMANAILPLRLGELARAYLLGQKEGISKVSTLATVAVARVFDGLALLLFAVLLFVFLPLSDWLKQATYVVAAIFVCVLVLFLLMASSKERMKRLTAFLARPLPHGWKPRIEEWSALFVTGLEGLTSPARVCAVFALSLVVWLGEGLQFYFVGLSFGLGQPFQVMLLASTAANLALLLPSSPGGVGNFEYFTAAVVTTFGVGAGSAAAYAIALHIVLLLPVVLLGLYFLWAGHMSLADVTHGPGAEQYPGGAEKQPAPLNTPQ